MFARPSISDAQVAGRDSFLDLLAQTMFAAEKGRGDARAWSTSVRMGDADKDLTIEDLGTASMFVLRAGRKSYRTVPQPAPWLSQVLLGSR